jgi:hypothetical protein
MSYKRNQIEEAISRMFAPDCERPSAELRTRVKRLLELDRSVGRTLRSKNAELANYGFFSEDAPGTGAVISFSEYEAVCVNPAYLRKLALARPPDKRPGIQNAL